MRKKKQKRPENSETQNNISTVLTDLKTLDPANLKAIIVGTVELNGTTKISLVGPAASLAFLHLEFSRKLLMTVPSAPEIEVKEQKGSKRNARDSK
jgi:hypothetical protein